ncbi:7489_t:CDS:2 [Funneliformis geosporum]|uniref:7489_t:CDS:1 n=1 Tax=Funneliformis geosporum TaxID=1117311 RepID=A0A9W4X410_9GLOM|nr:7489_t:CDS:2 [Funneliformis geosporum]
MNQNILENQINDHINDEFFDNIPELEEDFTFLYDNNAINEAFTFVLNTTLLKLISKWISIVAKSDDIQMQEKGLKSIISALQTFDCFDFNEDNNKNS